MRRKITKRQLRKIIREHIRILNETSPLDYAQPTMTDWVLQEPAEDYPEIEYLQDEYNSLSPKQHAALTTVEDAVSRNTGIEKALDSVDKHAYISAVRTLMGRVSQIESGSADELLGWWDATLEYLNA